MRDYSRTFRYKFNQNIKSPGAHLLVSIFKVPFCDGIIHSSFSNFYSTSSCSSREYPQSTWFVDDDMGGGSGYLGIFILLTLYAGRAKRRRSRWRSRFVIGFYTRIFSQKPRTLSLSLPQSIRAVMCSNNDILCFHHHPNRNWLEPSVYEFPLFLAFALSTQFLAPQIDIQ